MDNDNRILDQNFKNGFSIRMVNAIVCSNNNRAAMLYLLKNVPKNEMQAEKISERLGISHRTVAYHLNVLEDCGVVEVRKHRMKGRELVRSVWGISTKNDVNIILNQLSKEFDLQELEKIINKNSVGRRKMGNN